MTWQQLVQFALLGLGAGGVYVMLAQGVVLIYRGSGTVNFAHGALAMLGGYVFWDLRFAEDRTEQWAFLPSFVVAVIVTALMGAFIHLVIMKPLGKSSPLVRVIATLALLAILTAAAKIKWGASVILIPPKQAVLETVTWHWGSIAVQSDRIWLTVIATVITAALWAVFRFTRFGLAVVAAAEDERSASALGWSPDLLATVNWAVGGALAGAGGVLIASITGLEMNKATLLVIAALAAALLANFANFWVALIAGLVIGMAQSLMVLFQTKQTYLLNTPGLGEALPFLVIILVLTVRGRGLPLRSHVLERLPKLGSGTLPKWIILIPVALTVLSFTWFNIEWNTAFFTSYVFAILLLSVVVLTGFAGQISLMQMAIAGMAALVAGRMIEDHDLPFELALLIGIGGVLVVGLLFALPALRTRGINLAVTTLGLGLAVQSMIFTQGKYTGGVMNGVRVGEISFFGIEVDRTNHPERYAVFTLAWLVIVTMVVLNVRRGRAGRRLIAIRTNERAAASLGVGIFGAKMYAFGLAAVIAGLGGILFAFKDRTLSFENAFNPFSSINLVVLTVIGGIAYVLGPVMGMQLALGGIGSLISTRIDVDDNWIVLVGGLILLIQVVIVPNGMASHMSDAIDKSARKKAAKKAAAAVAPEATEVAPVRVKPAVLSVSNISVRLGSIYAVSEATLDVHTGEVVGLIGPNGAGKTTFIDAVTGFVRTTQGTVKYNDEVITGRHPAMRTRLGLIRTFQSLELFEDLSVRDNLLAGSDDFRIAPYFTDLVWPKQEHLPPAALRAIHDLGLHDVLDTPAGDLPYGKRRLVSIARALAGTPSILMLDEPAAGLSDAETGELRHLIRRLAEEWGIGVLLVEHDMSLVMAVCDRIVALETGKVIAEGRPDEIARDARVRAAYLGDEATVSEHHVLPDADAPMEPSL